MGDNQTQPSCECEDWRRHKLPCKHFCLLFIKDHIKWSDLSSNYTNSVYFKLDDRVVSMPQRQENNTSTIVVSEAAHMITPKTYAPATPAKSPVSSHSHMKTDCLDAISQIRTLLHSIPDDSQEITTVRRSLLQCVEELNGVAVTDCNLIVSPIKTPAKYTPLRRRKSTKKM